MSVWSLQEESRPSKGARFTVSVPLLSSASEGTKTIPRIPSSSLTVSSTRFNPDPARLPPPDPEANCAGMTEGGKCTFFADVVAGTLTTFPSTCCSWAGSGRLEGGCMACLNGLFDWMTGPAWIEPSFLLSISGGPGVGDLVPLRSIDLLEDDCETGGGPGGGGYSGRGAAGGSYIWSCGFENAFADN